MAPRYLLDTNIVSDLVRHPQGAIAEKVAQVGEESICTIIVVAGELRFDAAKHGFKRLSAQLDAVLSALEILPLEEPAGRHYGLLRRYLEQQGTPAGPNDMLIAAHALALDLTVITVNIRLSSRDLRGLQKRALAEGIPYQTLAASILHKYVEGRLRENG